MNGRARDLLVGPTRARILPPAENHATYLADGLAAAVGSRRGGSR